ncbi:cysteine-rich protein 1-like isoform X2 [Stegodyphus dumicola]|uniref:cysteine-rich protein 1-like isoform X2 n=1 Tax=Stegodyphus dumicola TaxID=202533 RepID=UPI0015A8B7EA|nr:cysteine-rich protein 1-like isoform X2 [Stegodyphus dumicola]
MREAGVFRRPSTEQLHHHYDFQLLCSIDGNYLTSAISAERMTSLGKDWHRGCLRCEKCNKTLTPGSHAEHEGKPYCNNPCYGALFGPGGFGRGGTESYQYKK